MTEGKTSWNRVKTLLDLAGTIVLIAAGTALLWRLVVGPARPTASEPAVRDVSALSIDADKIANVLGVGTVAIVEFSDFECPFCRTYATSVFPEIKTQFVDSGVARYVSFHFPLARHTRAVKAGEAAECARREGKYWQMSERLFARPMKLDRPDLTNHAAAIGLDRARFDECLAGPSAGRVATDKAEGTRLGVTGTPTFFLGSVRADGGIDLKRRIEGAPRLDVLIREVQGLDARPQRAKVE
jgi:Na+:H+ antiporter, NhaA family